MIVPELFRDLATDLANASDILLPFYYKRRVKRVVHKVLLAVPGSIDSIFTPITCIAVQFSAAGPIAVGDSAMRRSAISLPLEIRDHELIR
jgi:hypothetical protein